jgi:glycerol-3-phosphate dehydrogenase (NAD(P)+)
VIKEVGVIGAGSWGTTLANLLTEKVGRVHLWVYEKDLCETMARERENGLYLPGIKLLPDVIPTVSLEEASRGKDLVVSVVPSQYVRNTVKEVVPYLNERAIVLSASKGIETKTLMLMSQLLQEVLPSGVHSRMCFLSGPSFAREVAERLPTAVTLACKDRATASAVQNLLSTSYFRVYTSRDVMGVQLGGALKNVIALAAGASDGAGLGHNTKAALITRGLAEITRLGVAMGANALTFQGLSGMGDLVLTCTGDLSRNRTVGRMLGQGTPLSDILKNMKSVAEGVTTTQSAYDLARNCGVEMPITEAVHAILYGKQEITSTVKRLLSRRLTEEMYGISADEEKTSRSGGKNKSSHPAMP